MKKLTGGWLDERCEVWLMNNSVCSMMADEKVVQRVNNAEVL